ncbi:MAG TPA: VOC family protein [Gemmatimonadales bacterium]|nr:VOC family protein [Gemmatimonadales bacterium]
MKANPYLSFDGRCAEAFRFYAELLGGTIEMMMTYGESPDAGAMPPGWAPDWVLHTTLVAGDVVLMGSDAPREHYSKPAGTHVALHVDRPEEAERIFRALAEGGTVTMPLGETFWARRFGMLIDRFGTPWMINGGHPEGTGQGGVGA